MEFRGKHFHYVGTELLVKLRGDIQNIQQLEWAWALSIQASGYTTLYSQTDACQLYMGPTCVND